MLGDVNVDRPGTDVLSNQAGLCAASQVRCSEQLLEQCNSDGSAWVLLDQCASGALCDEAALACRPPACAAREHRCTSAGELQICNAERSGFQTVEQCQSAAFCSALPGREGCDVMPCRAGRQRCNGPQIEVCRKDRSGFDPVGEACASAALCREGESDVATCAEPACAPGRFSCDGAVLSRCSDEADAWIELNRCRSPEACLASEQRCLDTDCLAGVSQRCSGAVLERCNAAGSGFEPVETCSSPALCDPAATQCLVSPPSTGLPDPSVLDGDDYDFVELESGVVAGLGPLELRLPEEWADIDASPWTTATGAALGPRLIASTDAARFARSFDIPGVLFAATTQAPVSVAQRQQEFDLSDRCTRGALAEYDDGFFEGSAQTWTNCGVTSATTSVVVALDEDARVVTVVIVTMVAERDEEALDEIWDTFDVED